MTSFTITNKGKSEIERRYKIIAAIGLLVVAIGLWQLGFYNLLRHPDNYPNVVLYFYLIFTLFYLYQIFDVYPERLSRIIQSVEISENEFKITTLGYNIKYLPFKRKTEILGVKKEKVVFLKKKFKNIGFQENLPFSDSYFIKHNNKDYYLIPSLFNENDTVMDAVTVNTAGSV